MDAGRAHHKGEHDHHAGPIVKTMRDIDDEAGRNDPHVDWFICRLVHLAERQAQHRREVGAISPLQEQSAASAT